MKTTGLFLAILFAVFTLIAPVVSADAGGSERVVFGRYPAPSPDGTTLAFSWAGDLWTVPITGGNATRLTASVGYDWKPIYNPDGTKIAFMSDRNGSEDLYIINSRGGTPERITFATNNDILSGWTPDDDGLVFSSRRGGPWPNNRQPHVVYFEDARGDGPSVPEILVPCPGYGAVLSPDGMSVAFEYGPGNGYREGYRGTHKEDIWVYDTHTGEFVQITSNDFSNNEPLWSVDGSKIYYRSEESGVANLWQYDTASLQKTKLTSLRDTGLWHARVGGPGGAEIITYEYMGGIYIQDLPSGSPREIVIRAWLDEDPDTPSIIAQTGGASEYAISPDGNEMAFVIRGDIFCVRTDGVGGTEAARLTDHPARDWEIAWFPRGDGILFTSDRDGIEQLYRVISDDPDNERLSESHRFGIERLTHTDEPCSYGIISPPSPDLEETPTFADVTIAYARNRGDLWLMDGDGDDNRMLYSHWGTLNYTFSPDARWIAYSRQDDDYNVDVFIAAVNPDDPDLGECPLDGWQPFPGHGGAVGLVPSWQDGEVNITRHPDDDWMPFWSPDGSKLGFTSVRNFDNVDAYFVFLKRADEERSVARWEEEASPLPSLPDPPEPAEECSEEQDATDDEAVAEEEDAEEEDKFIVEIDFDDIHRRARRITTGTGNETLWGFSPDGEELVYTSDTSGTGEIWKVKWTGEDTTRIAGNVSPGWVTWHETANRIFYLNGGRISSTNAGGGDGQNHNFRASLNIDPLAERMYKFNEVWRLENLQFYDPDFHGHDWPALRDEYEPLVSAARHYRDFNDAVNLMLGRLNSSHLYFSDATRGPSAPETGYLGCGFVEDDQYGLLVDWITPGCPVGTAEFDLEPGDRVVSINGFNVGGWGDNPIGNWWRAMENTAGVEIEIGIIDLDSETAEPRWERIVPTTYFGWYGYEYENWLDGNRRMVDELSNGRLGYLHIERMYEGQLERFEQDLYTVGYGKDGIIIDVRWNSGGWVTDLLLAMLDTRRHAYTQPRDGELGYPEDRTPFFTTTAPIAVLVNEYSYSNAEVFAHAISNLDRGILVGWPTAGGVISTGGMNLADGSYLSLPRRGWWAIDTRTGEILYNLEHTGAVPDVMVNLLPSDIASGTDPQLIEAVRALLQNLPTRP